MRTFSMFLASAVLAMSSTAFADELSDAMAAAKAANKKAASVGYEWRDTGSLLKEAQAAADKGDKDKAMTLINEAHTQANMAYQQYLEQRAAGPHY